MIDQNKDRLHRQKPEIKCPISGCGNTLTKDDFMDDPEILRRAEKAKRRAERERRERMLREAREEEDQDEEMRDADEEMGDAPRNEPEGTQRYIKKEKSAKSRRNQRQRVVDLSDDDDE